MNVEMIYDNQCLGAIGCWMQNNKINWVQKTRKKVGHRWGNLCYPIDLLNKLSTTIMVLMNCLSKYRRHMMLLTTNG
jgi:hypothetical protein